MHKKRLPAIAIPGIAALAVIVAGTMGMFSCRTLECVRQEDWFKQKFNASIPLYAVAADEDGLLERSTTIPVKDRLDAILAHAPADGHVDISATSCAVVGNAPNLRGSHYGQFIDQHAYVFRMNNAPTRGYEEDVGTRTTFHVQQPLIPLYDHYDKDTIHLLVLLSAVADDLSSMRDLSRMDLGTAVDYSRLRIVNPDFIRYVNTAWFTVAPEGENKVPSTGFVTLIIALHMCRNVDLFGFGTTDSKGIWQHYFEDRHSVTPVFHHPEFQERFLRDMENRGMIKIYRGK